LAADPSGAPAADAAKTAFTNATQVAALTAAGFLVIGLAASASLSGRRRGQGGRRSTAGLTPDVSEPVRASRQVPQ
jgi:hypothetical protein